MRDSAVGSGSVVLYSDSERVLLRQDLFGRGPSVLHVIAPASDDLLQYARGRRTSAES